MKIFKIFYTLFNHRKIIKKLQKQNDDLMSGKFDLKVKEFIAKDGEIDAKFENNPFLKILIASIADAYSRLNPNNYASVEMQFMDDRTFNRYEIVMRHIGKGKTQHQIICELEDKIRDLNNQK